MQKCVFVIGVPDDTLGVIKSIAQAFGPADVLSVSYEVIGTTWTDTDIEKCSKHMSDALCSQSIDASPATVDVVIVDCSFIEQAGKVDPVVDRLKQAFANAEAYASAGVRLYPIEEYELLIPVEPTESSRYNGFPIEELFEWIGVRAYNKLKGNGIYTIAQLMEKTPADLRAIPGLGPRTFEEIREALAVTDRCLKGDEEYLANFSKL